MNKKAEEAAQHDGGIVKLDTDMDEAGVGDTIVDALSSAKEESLTSPVTEVPSNTRQPGSLGADSGASTRVPPPSTPAGQAAQ